MKRAVTVDSAWLFSLSASRPLVEARGMHIGLLKAWDGMPHAAGVLLCDHTDGGCVTAPGASEAGGWSANMT